ncbi:diaboline synthase-like [Apium graveolens]|uniref:diaboline synthase-like n=1 Tax=Apium graveolens TaxID=4045 RepID=UPI003D79598E
MSRRSALKSATKLVSILSTSQTLIKPALSTHPGLKQYNLSSRDVCTPDIYIPMVLFFPCPSASARSRVNKINHAERLKRSLAQTLTAYYPFAGRLSSSGTYVNCNDHGVEFVEARVGCNMSEILENPPNYSYDNDDSLGLLFRPGSLWDGLNINNNNSSPLMVVQLNHFDCGGLAMAVSVTHRIIDGCGLSAFLAHWAAVSSQSGKQVQPHYASWPSVDSVISPAEIISLKKSWITRRFVFQNSSLASIKALVAKQGLVENPTRVEVLTSLLYKSSIAASHSGSSSSVLIQPANMRSRLMVPETAVGNFYWRYFVEVNNEGEAQLHSLNHQIKKGKMELRNMDLSTMDDAEILGLTVMEYMKKNYKIYVCSSLCNFPFDKVDFGWGKPIKACLADGGFSNSFVLMDTPAGDGIEAMVCLDEQTMSKFESDEEILNATSTFL